MDMADYDRLWQEQMKAYDHASDTAEYWDRRARTFDSPWRTSTYTQELLRRMVLKPEYSVLDVACGIGTVAIPMAQQVTRVTALDISPAMLAKLKQRAASIGVNNISVVNKDWNQVRVNEDIEEHDVVLVSRSLPSNRLSESLNKMTSAARHGCYITWRGHRTDKYESDVALAMGKTHREYPDYRVIYGMLQSMGIAASIEIFDTTNEERFPSIEDAIMNMARGRTLTGKQKEKLFGLAKDRLTFVNGFFCSYYKMQWSLISWHKE